MSALNQDGLGTIYDDLDPAYDDCSDDSHAASDNSYPRGLTGSEHRQSAQRQGHHLGLVPGRVRSDRNQRGRLCRVRLLARRTSSAPRCRTTCRTTTRSSTTSPRPTRSTCRRRSEAAIGHTDQANHQYDLSLFYDTLKDGNLPSVSFLKASAYQDEHAGYSNPIDGQHFLVNTINQIEQSKYWKSTAIVITYDDSDGWYDHQVMPVVNGSNTSADTPFCSSVPTTLDNWTTRCGYGQRLPMLVISPWTRSNYVSGNRTDTTSIVRFIEDNWLRGQRLGGGSYDAIAGSLYARGGLLDFRTRPNFRPVILNPATGEVVSG